VPVPPWLHGIYAVAWLATWGNNMAAIEWGAAAAAVGWLARDHIGRHLAAWWSRHFGPHTIAHQREALRQHEEAKRKETGE
jgi:hypothetical protein